MIQEPPPPQSLNLIKSLLQLRERALGGQGPGCACVEGTLLDLCDSLDKHLVPGRRTQKGSHCAATTEAALTCCLSREADNERERMVHVFLPFHQE